MDCLNVTYPPTEEIAPVASGFDNNFMSSVESMSMSTTTAPVSPTVPVSYTHMPYGEASINYGSTTEVQPSFSTYNAQYPQHTQQAMCPCNDCVQYSSEYSSAPQTPMLPTTVPSTPLTQHNLPSVSFAAPVPVQHAVVPSCSYPALVGSTMLPAPADMQFQSADLPDEGSITREHFRKMQGKLNCLARTPKGSSTIQSAITEGEPERYAAIYKEFKPHFMSLLADANGAYVMKTLMETMTDDQVRMEVIIELSQNHRLIEELCVSSLHSRRVIQYFVDRFQPRDFQAFIEVCIARCYDIAISQHGCICMQRVLDKASPEQRHALFQHLLSLVPELATHPFGNYVVQYMVEMGGRDVNAQLVSMYLKNRITELSCNKFASNVVEKCLYFAGTEVQHMIIDELYNNKTEQQLEEMIQDSFGNYIVQATLALANFQDIWMISERLRPVLNSTPYGHKIEARLQRRLRGKKIAPNTKSFPGEQRMHQQPSPDVLMQDYSSANISTQQRMSPPMMSAPMTAPSSPCLPEHPMSQMSQPMPQMSQPMPQMSQPNFQSMSQPMSQPMPHMMHHMQVPSMMMNPPLMEMQPNMMAMPPSMAYNFGPMC